MLSDDKGKEFEARVHTVLEGLARDHPEHVTLSYQPTLELQNGERVRPDFRLIVDLPYERSHYFIECQDRTKFSKDLLHKIQHVRSKQSLKTFVFVYPEEVAPEIARAMNSEGVMQFSAKGLETFVARLDEAVRALAKIKREDDRPDRAVMGDGPSL